jgi:dTDP-4-dehydrorhamnose reductase
LAKAAKHAKLICFSSDQVYGGSDRDGPYTEADARPANLYATHKLEMEQRVLDVCPQAVLLRAEWMYDYYTKKSNYFMHLLTAVEPLRFSKNQYRGVTYVKEVALNMERVKMLPGGVYNFGSETTKSMYDITAECLSLLGKTVPLEEAPPRHNLWMNCDKAKRYGVTFSCAEEGFRRCAADYGLLK